MLPTIDRFEILGAGSLRPDAEKIIFCDGTDDRLYRPETDLELSHWRPNRTPVEFRAGTSTEICLRFLDNPRPGNWTVAVNNHTDVDGILSVYTLTHPQSALRDRQTLVQAAEMGDFWGWGDIPAQRVFQGLTRMMTSNADGREVYTEAFRRIPQLVDGSDPETAELEYSLAPLRVGREYVESGLIHRVEIDPRLSHYIVSLAAAGDEESRAFYVPGFNEAISNKALLWPQVRARCDSERVQIVSFERQTGWNHDLWFPGYGWADTEGKWNVPGLTYADGMSSYDLNNSRLIESFEQLQRLENATGQWCLGGTRLPFGEELQKRFPLVGRFLDEVGQPAISRLSPEQVSTSLTGVFC